MEDLFKSIHIDRSGWLKDIKHTDSSLTSFFTCAEECISERERMFEEELSTTIK